MVKVKVYSTPACSICKQLKSFLNEKKVKFEDINVASDPKAAQEMIEKSGQMSVPVVDIDGTVLTGFDRKKLIETLKIK